MQDEPIIVDFDFAAPEIDPSLRAFIVYEDIATGKKAKEVCDMVTEKLGPRWNIQIEISSFKSLCMPQMRQTAVASIARANLVVFSCYAGALPSEVWAWSELWMRRPAHPTALVALLTATRGQTARPCAVEKYLAGVARRLGLDYFSLVYNPPDGAAVDPSMPVMQKEQNDNSSCATNTCDHHSGGVHTQ